MSEIAPCYCGFKPETMIEAMNHGRQYEGMSLLTADGRFRRLHVGEGLLPHFTRQVEDMLLKTVRRPEMNNGNTIMRLGRCLRCNGDLFHLFTVREQTVYMQCGRCHEFVMVLDYTPGAAVPPTQKEGVEKP